MKWTVIIPTLWRSVQTKELLHTLDVSDNIDEIVLIDNAQKLNDEHIESFSEKFTIIRPVSNVYVNPAWNMGVDISRNDNIVISNDDIVWNPQILNHIDEDTLIKSGIIGQSFNNYKIHDNSTNIPKIVPTKTRNFAWGCMMLIHKSNWKPIPEQLKVWYGDDWLIYKSGLNASKMDNVIIRGEIGTTSEKPEFSAINLNDQKEYNKL